MLNTSRTARGYCSPLRDARAADTKERIISAAADLFLRDGFGRATVAAIARHAGVSGPTVYATFGSKDEIMRALLTRTEETADAAGWRARIADEPNLAAKLAHFAAWSTELFSTSHALLVVSLRAGDAPSVIEFHETGDRNRRRGLAPIISALDDANALPDHLSPERALDIAWMLTGPELYVRSVDGCGWSDDTYQRWLADMLQHQLLDKGRHT